MKVHIYREFQILGHKVVTKIVTPDELAALVNKIMPPYMQEDGPSMPGDEAGLYDHTTHTIYLSNTLAGTELIQSWLHEKQHCLLYSAGRTDLSEDEDFVDLMAELEFQSLKTQKVSIKVST